MKNNSFWSRLKREITYIRNNNWSLDDVGRHWDETVDYDSFNERTYSYFRRFTDGLKNSSFPDKGFVLDIACRTGQGTYYFWKKGKIRKAVCADVSSVQLAICHNFLKEKGVNHQIVKFKLPLPFPDNYFDGILCFETVEHVPSPDIFIQELYRVVKKKGKLILTTPNKLWEPVHWIAAIFNFHHSEGPHSFLSYPKLRNYILDTGFTIYKEITTVLIPAGPRWMVKLGERIEETFPSLMPYLGLRRIFVCEK